MTEHCHHEWVTAGAWGVVLGVSRCRKCGVVARAEHFQPWANPPPTGPNSHHHHRYG